MSCLDNIKVIEEPGGCFDKVIEAPTLAPCTDCGSAASQAQNTLQTCTAECEDGAVFTYTVPAGLFIGDNQQLADAAALAFACRKATERLLCIGALDSACQDQEYEGTVTVSRATNTTAASWSIYTGALPAGLTFTPSVDGQSATIAGTPTTLGDTSFGIQIVENDPEAAGAFGVLRKDFVVTVEECVVPVACVDPISGELSGASDTLAVREILTGQSPFYAITATYEATEGRSVKAAYTAVGFTPVFYFMFIGTATGGAGLGDELEDTTQSWPLNCFAGATLVITAGTNAGFTSVIYANSADTIHVNDAFPSPPDATTEYAVLLKAGTTETEFVPEFSGTVTVAATTASASDVGTVDVAFTCCNVSADIIAVPNASIAYDPLTDKLYGNSIRTFEVEVMNPTTQAVITSLPYDAWSPYYSSSLGNCAFRSPTDGFIYTGMIITGAPANISREVRVFDPSSDTLNATLTLLQKGATPSQPTSLDYDPVNGYIMVGCNNLNRIDPNTHAIIDKLDNPTSRRWRCACYMAQSDVVWMGCDTGSNGTPQFWPIDVSTSPPTVLPTLFGPNGGYIFSGASPFPPTGLAVRKIIPAFPGDWYAIAQGSKLVRLQLPVTYDAAWGGGNVQGTDGNVSSLVGDIVDIYWRASNSTLYASTPSQVLSFTDPQQLTGDVVECAFPGGYFAEDGAGNLLLSGPCIQYIA